MYIYITCIVPIKRTIYQDHELNRALDIELIKASQPALNEGVPVTMSYPVTNLNRTVGR